MVIHHKRNSYRRHKNLRIEESPMFQYLEQFLEYCDIQGESGFTIERRESSLRRFVFWCRGGRIHDVCNITPTVLKDYQRYLHYYRKSNGEPLSHNSKVVYIGSIVKWCEWLYSEGVTSLNPAQGLNVPARKRTLPRPVISLGDVQSVLAQPDVLTVTGIRDRAIMEVFYATGMRRNELIHLYLPDFDELQSRIFVRQGKGGKERYVPLTRSARRWILAWLSVRCSILLPAFSHMLFVSDYGEPFSGSTMTTMIKQYLKRAGVVSYGSCHVFRHAMATHMLEAGADVRVIQDILGHQSLESTQIYTRVTLQYLSDVYSSCHPLAE